VIGNVTDPVSVTQRWVDETPGWRVRTTEALDIPELRDALDELKSDR
jgi:hypothetical protein